MRTSTIHAPGCLLLLLAVLLVSRSATATEIVGVRWFSAPDHTRVVLDLAGPATYEVRVVVDPPRVAVNLPGARFADPTPLAIADGLVVGLRCQDDRRRAQLVIDLAAAAGSDHFYLAASEGRPPRIVVDVFRPAPAPPAARAPAPAPASRSLTVILDPGHGGLDPGASRGRILEKDIVLDVARQVAAILSVRDGVTAVLTRNEDWYPSLADRVAAAADAGGDLFVSIHCNSHRRQQVRGMEVYFLSLQGATDHEAQALADKENAADLVGLAAGDEADDVVLTILMDLHMGSILQRSRALSERILAAAAAEGLATRRVKQARFQVLRSLAMPSALVELAYLTNPDDRRLLTTEAGRRTLAEVVAAGIEADLDARAPVAVAAVSEPVWQRHYKVRAGDTLWSLARHHGTTVAAIRLHNNLKSDRVQAGQYLNLPEGQSSP